MGFLIISIVCLSVAAVWVIRKPFNGVLLLFWVIPLTIPLIGNRHGGMSFINVRLYDLVAVITFIAILGAILIGKHPGFPATSLGFPFAVYCFGNLLSLMVTPNLADSVRQFIKLFVVNVPLFLLVTASLNSYEKIRTVLKILLIGGVIVFAVGTLQNILFHYFDLNLYYIRSNHRATATFDEAGWYSQYISLLFSIALPLFLFNTYPRWRPWLSVFLLMSLVVVVSERSRAAYVLIVAALLTMAMLYKPKIQIRVFWNLSKYIVLALIVSSLIYSAVTHKIGIIQIRNPSKMFSAKDPSNVIRFGMIRHTWDHIEQHPIVGNGIGTWSRVVLAEIGQPGRRGGSAFNLVLGAWYDGGILAVIGVFMIGYTYLKRCFTVLKYTCNSYQESLIYVAILISTNLFLAAQFHPSWLQGYSWLGLALGVSIIRVVRNEISHEDSLCSS